MILSFFRILELMGPAAIARRSSFCRRASVIQQWTRYAMKSSCLIPILALSLFFISGSCDAKRAYMWTDEKGIPHISDQPPPQGVDAMSFSAERDSLQDESAVSEGLQKEEGPLQESSSKKNSAKSVDSRPAGNTAADFQKTPQYRDPSTLTRTERIELTVLETSKDRVERLYKSSSSEEERIHWKTELEQMKAQQRKILEVPAR
jgi:hypothetical protein